MIVTVSIHLFLLSLQGLTPAQAKAAKYGKIDLNDSV